jgi:L-histidine N-alpha-methyltransferase
VSAPVVHDRTAGTSVRHRLLADLRQGLAQQPPSLPPKWFYDEKGSLLFEQITELPEYYPSRTEEALLLQHAGTVASRTGARTLVELGSGASRKTRILLDALCADGRALRFVPLDVSVEMLTAAALGIAADYPQVTVEAIAADFDAPLGPLPGQPGSRLVAFLGSTIGNLLPAQRAQFLAGLRAQLVPGDAFLLGADLIKDPRRLVPAYDDAAGVTAAFNRNVIAVLARELMVDLDPEDFDHVARWDASTERMEMRLRARRDVRVVLDSGTDLVLSLRRGEELLTETSAKFRVRALQAELASAGLEPAFAWTDANGDYALLLATVTSSPARATPG